MNWTNHRFVRLRTFVSALEAGLSTFRENWRKNDLCARPRLDEVIEGAGPEKAPPDHQSVGYRFRDHHQRTAFTDLTKDVLLLARLMEEHRSHLLPGPEEPEGHSPRPKPVFRLDAAPDRDPLREYGLVPPLAPPEQQPPSPGASDAGV